jgi:glycosyltransferase involved in cell wall biosynthesis
VKPSLVSIVIPCYKGNRHLGAAIESCLRQTHRELEVIAVDDASPDDDFRIAERYAAQDDRVRVIRRPHNGGVARAFNTGFEQARGEYFTRLAQDDLFREDALGVMISHLRANPTAGLAYCDMQLVDDEGRYLQPMKCRNPSEALLPCNRVGLCVMWPKAVWERVGPFNPRFDFSEDYEFFLRLSRQFPLHKCGDADPFFFRYHPAQASARHERRHDMARARAHIAHNWALWKSCPHRIGYWKRIGVANLRLLAAKLDIYRYFKYDGKTGA